MPSRRRTLDTVMARLQMRYGPAALNRAALPPARAPVPHITTTFAGLDTALGIGGLPRGRISEIIGPATSGKITVAAKVLAAAQRDPDALVTWVDLGRTCDPDYLHRCGLDLERLLIVRPETGVDALAITMHLVESNTLAALVFDGLAELDAGADSFLAGALERLAGTVTRTETVVIFLVEPRTQYRTLAHLATVRLEIHTERWLTRNGDVRGYEGLVHILKHKLAPAGATVPIRITFNGTVTSDGQL